jgi:FixJ family two-component response regulator
VVREAVSACRQPVPVRIRHPAVTPAETRAVVELVGRTVSADAIAYTLGVAARTVQRHRARLHP